MESLLSYLFQKISMFVERDSNLLNLKEKKSVKPLRGKDRSPFLIYIFSFSFFLFLVQIFC